MIADDVEIAFVETETDDDVGKLNVFTVVRTGATDLIFIDIGTYEDVVYAGNVLTLVGTCCAVEEIAGNVFAEASTGPLDDNDAPEDGAVVFGTTLQVE